MLLALFILAAVLFLISGLSITPEPWRSRLISFGLAALALAGVYSQWPGGR